VTFEVLWLKSGAQSGVSLRSCTKTVALMGGPSTSSNKRSTLFRDLTMNAPVRTPNGGGFTSTKPAPNRRTRRQKATVKVAVCALALFLQRYEAGANWRWGDFSKTCVVVVRWMQHCSEEGRCELFGGDQSDWLDNISQKLDTFPTITLSKLVCPKWHEWRWYVRNRA